MVVNSHGGNRAHTLSCGDAKWRCQAGGTNWIARSAQGRELSVVMNITVSACCGFVCTFAALAHAMGRAKMALAQILRQKSGRCLTDPLALTGGDSCVRLGLRNAEERGHFVVLEALARSVRLHPRTIDDELWDGSLSVRWMTSSRGAGISSILISW